MSKSLFSSTEYVLYRFEYPESLFFPLRSHLSPIHRNEELRVLDLGCGTGLVTESFLKFFKAPLAIHLIDPDREMLRESQKKFAENSNVKSFECASAEKIPHENDFFDLVLIGSAWHWMNQESAVREIDRVLKPGGVVFVFEYQFPKCVTNKALNDWIRLQFNLEWKPASQTPRGNLKELTECWRSHHHFSQCGATQLTLIRNHDASGLAGVIVSQSRYQHYVQSFSGSEQTKKREELVNGLDSFLMGKAQGFEYCYEGYLLKKRV